MATTMKTNKRSATNTLAAATKTTDQKALVAIPDPNDPPTAKQTKVLEPHDVVLSSNAQNAVGIQAWGKFAGEASLQALDENLGVKTRQVTDGDMRPIEGMLYRQAKTLETIFTHLSARAAGNTSLKQFQVNLTLALKAQAQCRSTLEALAEIKNPRTVSFVKQSNVTTGPQQVNNTFSGTASEDYAQVRARGENSITEPNKLLKADHGQRMVIGAQGQAGRANQAVDALEAVHRA